ASVVIDHLHLQRRRVQALVVNSGNANACTGAQRFKDALLMAKITADHLDLDPDQVLVSSTGVIGRYMPMEAVKSGIINACGDLDAAHGLDAAHAIMTTDSKPKLAELEVDLGGVPVTTGWDCNGTGMIHSDMATVLAQHTSDAAVQPCLVAAQVNVFALL